MTRQMIPFFSLFALAAVTWASLTSWFPELPYVTQVPFYDKWAHFVMYAFLSLAFQLDYAMRGRRRMKEGKPSVRRPRLAFRTVCFFVAPALWGALMEVAQSCLTSYRTGDPVDAAANAVGALLGFAFSYPLLALLLRSSSRPS